MPSPPRPVTPTSPHDLRGMRRKWVLGLLLPLAGVVLALLSAEVGLRVGARVSPRLSALLYVPTVCTEYDDAATTRELLARGYFGYQPFGATRGFVLNSRGFRTHEYREEKPAGTYRVVALGDSFTFDSSSVPLGQMWHQVAGDELERSLGRPVEVINLGQPAVGPRFALNLWELEGARLSPDLVVFAFFVGNDFTDESGTPLEPDASGRLAHASYLWRLVRNRERLTGGVPDPDRRRDAAEVGREGRAPNDAAPGTVGGFEFPWYPATYDPTEPMFPEDRFLEIEAGRLAIVSGPDEARFRRLCEEVGLVIERLARGVEASGARFLVMVIPDEFQVDPHLLQSLVEGPTAVDVERPQRCLRGELDERGVPVLDLLPLFRRRTAEGGAALYKPRDTHWTARGNRVAGRALARQVLRRGISSPE